MMRFQLPLMAGERDDLPVEVGVVCDVEADRDQEVPWGEFKPAMLLFGDQGQRWVAQCDQTDIVTWLGELTEAVSRGPALTAAALVHDELMLSPEGVTRARWVVGVLVSGELFTVLRQAKAAVLEWRPDHVQAEFRPYVRPLETLLGIHR